MTRCTGECRLSDQAFIARYDGADVVAGHSHTLAGCRLCGELHEFRNAGGGQPEVSPVTPSYAIRRYDVERSEIERRLKRSLDVSGSGFGPNSTELEGDFDSEPAFFRWRDRQLIVSTQRIGAQSSWTNRAQSVKVLPAEGACQIIFRFLVDNNMTRLFAFGIGAGDDFEHNAVGHYAQIYGDAVWAVAKGTGERCVPTGLSLKTQTPYIARFGLSSLHSTLELYPEDLERDNSFEHRADLGAIDQPRVQIFAYGSSEVAEPASMYLLSLRDVEDD